MSAPTAVLTAWLVIAGLSLVLLLLPRLPRRLFVLWALLAALTAIGGVVLVLRI